MDVNKGDKFLCKKSNKGHTNDFGVEENVWYYVVKIDNENLIPNQIRFLQVSDGKSVFNYNFRISQIDERYAKSVNTLDYFWDYFYTPQELRKFKLLKLNEYR